MSHTYDQAIIRPDERLALRVNDAALMAGLDRSTIYKLIDNGQLRSTKVGGRRLVLWESLQQLLQAGGQFRFQIWQRLWMRPWRLGGVENTHSLGDAGHLEKAL